MELSVQNKNILYSVSFNEEISRIGVRELSNGLYEFVITLPITVWHIIEHQRQQFDTYHQGLVPITENQPVVSGHHYPHVNGSDFPANYVAGNFQCTFSLEEGQSQNSWFATTEICQVLSPEVKENLL